MKNILIILIINLLANLPLCSQKIDKRVSSIHFFDLKIDTCDCKYKSIKKYKYNFCGKQKKKPFSVITMSYKNKKNINKLVKYDSLNRPIIVYYYSNEKNNYFINKIKYYNNHIEYIYYNCFSEDILKCNPINSSRHYFDSNKNITSSVFINNRSGKVYYFYDYDNKGNLITKYIGNSKYKDSTKGKSIVEKYKYDKNNNEIKHTSYAPYPNIISEHVINYKNNKVLNKNFYSYGKFFSGSSFEYFENGKIKSETYYEEKKKFDSKFIYSYNNNGSIKKITKVNKKGKPKIVDIYEYKK